MTPAGHRDLRELLARLKTKDRPVAVRALEEARAHGDLSENAEYDIAKANLAQLDRQIGEVGQAVANAQIIDPSTIQSEQVVFGATVQLCDAETDAHIRYQIVGVYESDVDAGRISIESPIARALIGKEAGDEARVNTPRGLRSFTIIEVSYE